MHRGDCSLVKDLGPRTFLLCKPGLTLWENWLRTERGKSWRLWRVAANALPRGPQKGTWLCFPGNLGVCHRCTYLLGMPMMINYLLWSTKKSSAGVTPMGSSWSAATRTSRETSFPAGAASLAGSPHKAHSLRPLEAARLRGVRGRRTWVLLCESPLTSCHGVFWHEPPAAVVFLLSFYRPCLCRDGAPSFTQRAADLGRTRSNCQRNSLQGRES